MKFVSVHTSAKYVAVFYMHVRIVANVNEPQAGMSFEFIKLLKGRENDLLPSSEEFCGFTPTPGSSLESDLNVFDG
jgi:hypothetical protein